MPTTNTTALEALKLIATATASEHQAEYMRGLARTALRQIESSAPRSDAAALEALPFSIDSGSPRILTWKTQGCRPATSEEALMWDALESSAPSAPNFRDLLSRAHAIRTGWTYEFVAEVEAALAAPPAPAPSAASERAAFEVWARPLWKHPEDFDQRIKAERGTYNSIEVQAAWLAWQARAALHSTGKPDGEVALPKGWDLTRIDDANRIEVIGPDRYPLEVSRSGATLHERVLFGLADAMLSAAPADAPVAEPVALTDEFRALLKEWHVGFQYGPHEQLLQAEAKMARLITHPPAPEDAKDAARRVQKFIDCRKGMRGIDPNVIFTLTDREGATHNLTVADLAALSQGGPQS